MLGLAVNRLLTWLGRKVRGPLWLWWNLTKAAIGGRVHQFADRVRTEPARRLMWRVLLSLVLLVKLPLIAAGLVAVAVVLGLAVPPVLLCTYAWGSLREIWRD